MALVAVLFQVQFDLCIVKLTAAIDSWLMCCSDYCTCCSFWSSTGLVIEEFCCGPVCISVWYELVSWVICGI